MPDRMKNGRPLMDERRTKQKRIRVAHLWWDYVPESFVEPHSYFRFDPQFSSRNLVCQLWENGKKADAATSFLYRAAAQKLVNPGVVFRIFMRLSRPWRWTRFRRFVRRSFQANSPALVHSHFGTTACEMTHLEKPQVVTFYGYDGSAALFQPATVKKYQEMFPRINKIIVLCEAVKQRLVELGCERNKIAVWNMPAGVERYPYFKRKPGSIFRIVMAARFAEAKGHEYLLEAVHRLVQDGRSLHLTLLGYGNRAAQIKNRIDELGLSSHVTLTDNHLTGDFHAAYRSVLEQSDLFVLPSIRDSRGTDEAGPALTMVCAQASGIPVVCTPFPGAEISLIPGETGLFCAEKDPTSLADCIDFFLQNPEQRETMGRRASELANREFSEWTQMDELTRIYEEVLGIFSPLPSTGTSTLAQSPEGKEPQLQRPPTPLPPQRQPEFF
ncbi:MAG: glycosyltransferase family 4 protein [Bacteriovoracia bacterium]